MARIPQRLPAGFNSKEDEAKITFLEGLMVRQHIIAQREAEMAQFALHVNDTARSVEADGNIPLLWVLRDLLELTGTKIGQRCLTRAHRAAV